MDMQLGDTQLIIDECKKHDLTREQAAYVLATAFWETARTMEPVEEAFWLSDSWRRKNLRYYPWHGRGYVQLTWEANYIKAGEKLGLDLTTDPRAVMDPEIAAQILVVGSRDGWFTGHRLDRHINDEKTDYTGARRVINGTDKAAAIAALADDYFEALTGYDMPEEEPAKPSFWALITSFLARLFR